MLDLLKKPIEYLFDETKSKLSKITYLGFIVLIVIFLNDIFWFSYNYSVSNKINNIHKIENIKKEYSNNYFMSEEYIKELNILEKQVIEKESFTYFVYNYIRQITIWEINVDFPIFFSVQFLWLIMIGVFLFQMKQTGVKTALWMILIIIGIMVLWQLILQFLSSSLALTQKNHIFWHNIFINIIFIIFVIIIWNKKKS